MAIALDPTVATVTKVDLDVNLEGNEFWGTTSETGGHGEITLLQDVYAPLFFRSLEELLELKGLPTG